jgi:hypothetical protein
MSKAQSWLPTVLFQPGAHTQVCEAMPSVHVPPFAHGVDPHSSILTEQSSLPALLDQPGAHVQVNELIKSVHVPPFWHGDERHSSTLTSQLNPSQPATQEHEYAAIVSVHWPLMQGADAHSSMLVAQVGPEKPARQEHVKCAMLFEHVALLSHGPGDVAHSSMSTEQSWLPRLFS